MAHAYQIIGSGVDHTGWFKFYLRRDDGRDVKVSRKRMADLRRAGQVCDCQAPVVESGAAGVSEDCPIHAPKMTALTSVL